MSFVAFSKGVVFVLIVVVLAQYALALDAQRQILPPMADVEYVLHVNPGKGGWVVVKFWTYGRGEVSFGIGQFMRGVVNITGASVSYTYDRARGVITLVVGGRAWAWFNYTFPRLVWYYQPSYGGYLPKRVLIVDVGADYVQMWPKEAFFQPYTLTPKTVAIRLDGVLKEWYVVAAYSQRTEDLLYFEYNMFLQSPFLAGKLYKLAEAKAEGVTVYFPIFESKLLLNDYLNTMGYDGTYDPLLGAQYKANVIARGIDIMMKLLGLPPPVDRAYMHPLRKTLPEGARPESEYITDMGLYGGVWVFHNDMIWRIGHILHHYVTPWLTYVYALDFRDTPEPIWYKGMQDYVGYVAASMATNSSIYNGSLIVPRYILYLRAFEERKYSPGTMLGGPSWIKYVYAPLAMFYLDNILREKSGGALDIYKLHGLAVANKKWQFVEVSEVASMLKREFKIDMYKYFDEVRDLNLNKTLLKRFVEEGKWYSYFYTFLDFIRENFTLAPDTLYAVYLEYVAWKGDPEETLYPFNLWRFEEILGDLVKALNGTKPLTKEAFIAALNKITGGKSSDFFDFYTKTRLNVSASDVEAFLNGTYPRVLGKIISAKKVIKALPVDATEFKRELDEAYAQLKRGDYSGAELLVDRLLEKLYETKRQLYEAKRLQGGYKVGKIEIDGDIGDWVANSEYVLNVTKSRAEDSCPTIPGNAIKSVYVAHDDNYLYVAIQFFDKPYSPQNRIQLVFDRDLDLRTDNDRVGLEFAIPNLIGVETLGLGYFGDFVEVKIPLETLRLMGVGRKFLLRVWVDTWGMGLPYDVPGLERRCMNSLDVVVDLDSLPNLSHVKAVGATKTVTTTVVQVVTTSVTTTATRTVTETSERFTTITQTVEKTATVEKTSTTTVVVEKFDLLGLIALAVMAIALIALALALARRSHK
ncbi:DOMON domain-containing protein [Pyrobaculum calidifontis]|nr:hypothetical protein [Pyrobaculum calidifontis]